MVEPRDQRLRNRRHAQQLVGPHTQGGLQGRHQVESRHEGNRAWRCRSTGRRAARAGSSQRSLCDRLHVHEGGRERQARREGHSARRAPRRSLRHAERAEFSRQHLPAEQCRVPVRQPSSGKGAAAANSRVPALRTEPRGPAAGDRGQDVDSAQRRVRRHRAQEAGLIRTMKPLLISVAAVLVLWSASSLDAARAATDALPDYKPEKQVSGVLRSWGNDHMAELLALWQKGFSKYHPEIRYQDTLKGTATAQWGLQEWVADIALMGRQIWPYEYYGTYRRSSNFPVEIAVATGSYDVPGKSPALAIFVHKDNPITQLTLEQLDRIFGAERTGGWQRLDWVREGVARGADTNIRTW